ncbi:hypothetical protein GCM10010381_30080 [Streptomyces xantholiticus]|nr:hypothetical protein GCM10010381_30080 [Streptomyces xantholiticus]
MYNGALAEMGLGSDPYTGNRYAFTGGNPRRSWRWTGTALKDCRMWVQRLIELTGWEPLGIAVD